MFYLHDFIIFICLFRLFIVYLTTSKILSLENTQINLEFCSLIRIFAAKLRSTNYDCITIKCGIAPRIKYHSRGRRVNEKSMSSPEMVDILRKGDEEIKDGKGKVVTLDEIWK